MKPRQIPKHPERWKAYWRSMEGDTRILKRRHARWYRKMVLREKRRATLA